MPINQKSSDFLINSPLGRTHFEHRAASISNCWDPEHKSLLGVKVTRFPFPRRNQNMVRLPCASPLTNRPAKIQKLYSQNLKLPTLSGKLSFQALLAQDRQTTPRNYRLALRRLGVQKTPGGGVKYVPPTPTKHMQQLQRVGLWTFRAAKRRDLDFEGMRRNQRAYTLYSSANFHHLFLYLVLSLTLSSP